MLNYFEDTIGILDKALKSINEKQFYLLVNEAEAVLKSGHKIVASGLGKNVPICDKFVGTMVSMGLDANFLHTNSAVHGDIGMVHAGDMVIILTKSGSTHESVYLVDALKQRDGVILWLITFSDNSPLYEKIGHERCLVINLEHEGDLWNVMPNNSTTLNLIVLQVVAMQLAHRFKKSLEYDFKPNHPGGAIGEYLKNES